jgi:serine/threonine protein kinase
MTDELLFLAALEKSTPEERQAFLEQACGQDVALRARVQLLLEADARSRGILERCAAPADGTAAYALSATVGQFISDRYKLLEEIGEGGMGTVWVAEQTKPVKRKVALKLIKPGMDSKAVLARFEAERQALALMDHPNIAKVLDGGLTETGRPFFVMEYFKGVPITQYCDAARLSVPDRLHLFSQVCSAVQHAHQKGIIHRDLKPSNILVAPYDDRPVPKVIDFGLAKAMNQALTERTLHTAHDSVLGTPLYMSPEQAQLNNLDVDTRCDIYSLGVLLYELLTGTTPLEKQRFKEAAWDEVRRIIREEEPPRPSTRLSSTATLPSLAACRQAEPAHLTRLIRGDLDWIVMKSLEKDRARRYESANGLARDIQRYLADEVVEARPPSVGYRVSKFVRRHKGQVIAATLVLVALVVGIVGTTLGLFEAKRQERIARDESAEKEKARLAESERVKERDAALKDLAQAHDNLLSVGARGLLRPLQRGQAALNDQEVEALWELAAATDERLRLRFVALALDDPVLRRLLRDRAPFALQAAVGLDPTRRRRVEELLSERLVAGQISPQEQEQMAYCLAHLGGLDRRLVGRTVAALTQAMSKGTDPYAMRNLAQALSPVAARLEPKEASATLTQAMSKTTHPLALESLTQALLPVAARLEPKEAAQLCSQGAATLTQVMSKTTDPHALCDLAEALSAVSARLEPKEAAQLCGQGAATLTQAMSKTTDPHALCDLAEALSAVSAPLEPKEAALCGEGAAILTQAMSKTTDESALQSLTQGLSAVAARLEPKEAVEVAATLTQAITKTTNPSASLRQGLSAVAARMPTKEAAEVAASLAQAMTKATNSYILQPLAQGLSAVAARLEPKEAVEVAGTPTQAMTKTTNPYTPLQWDKLQSMKHGLSAVVARLEPKDLSQVMSKTTDPGALVAMAQRLSAVAARLEPKEAAEVAVTLTQAISKTTAEPPFSGYTNIVGLAQGLSAVSVHLEPKDAARLCRQAAATLTQALSKDDRYVGNLTNLGKALAALSAHLEEEDVAQAAAILTEALSKTDQPIDLIGIAEALPGVTAPLQPKEAARLCRQAAATFTQAMSKPTDSYRLESMAQGLAAVSACLESKEAAALLTQAMSTYPSATVVIRLAQGLSAVAARLEPKEAAEVAATLIEAMSKTTDPPGYIGIVPSALQYAAHALSAVAARLEPNEAAATLSRAIRTTADPGALAALSHGLLAVAARLEQKAAAALLIQAMTTHPLALAEVAPGLSAVAARLESKEAAEVAATLTQAIAMSKATDSSALQSLTQGLSAVTARLEPKEAAEVAASLTQAMSKSTHPLALQSLTQRLSAVAARLEPKQVAEVAAALSQAMSQTIDPGVLAELAQGLSAVSSRLEPKEAAQLCGQAAATVIETMSKTTHPQLAPGLSAALARELPPETLVDLLKHPFCEGEARHLVLDALTRHYHRSFADQWDFVDYVEQQRLGLDLTTPPARSSVLR